VLCLDTNVIIGLLNGRPPILRERFAQERLARNRMALSSIALFELRFGAANSARPEANARMLDALLSEGIDILDFNSEDADEAGKLRAHFKRAGTPIGPYDILIAAQARRRSATLVTANVGEFSRTPGLIVVDWAVA